MRILVHDGTAATLEILTNEDRPIDGKAHPINETVVVVATFDREIQLRLRDDDLQALGKILIAISE